MVGEEMMEGPALEMAEGAGGEQQEKLGLKKAEDAQAETPEQRQALVTQILAEVKSWEDHHKKSFEKMKRHARFVKNKEGEQWRGVGGDAAAMASDKYVANITHRLIQQKVASLYARNPRARARRRPMVDYIVWDGRQETLQTAMQTITMAQQAMQSMGAAQMGVPGAIMPPQPSPAPMMDPMMAAAIVKEAIQIRQNRDKIDRIGKTAEIMFHHSLDRAKPAFKARMKQAVRRACTTGVAWVKLDFERAFEGRRPETNNMILDAQDRADQIERKLKEMDAGDLDTASAELESLRLQIDGMTKKEDMLVREGVLFDFPKAWDVIPDMECQQLIGLLGCKKMAHRFESTPERIKDAFGIDLKGQYQAHVPSSAAKRATQTGEGNEKDKVFWYEVYDSVTGLVYSVLEGYPDFLCEPSAPRVDVEQFFPFYPLVLNEVENEGDLYPPSEVDLVEHMQKELNRSREALRQHRIAAAPFWLAGNDKLSESDVDKLKSRSAHDVLLIQALIGNQKITDVFQQGPTSAIDPNLYQDQHIVQDILRATGVQDANLGPTTGNTATEAGIAESSRSKADSSNVGDIDDLLSQLAHDWCRTALKEVSLEMAKRIAGPGAVWPEISGGDFADVLYLDIVAGSSGKPNRDREAAAFERIMPMLMNVPGINPDFLARKGVELLDDAVDMDDALLSGVPSVLAMNAMFKNAPGMGAGPENTPTGDPRTDPNMQGGAGGANMDAGMGISGGPQAGNPAPTGSPMTGGPVV
jgi:hypothetical protein